MPASPTSGLDSRQGEAEGRAFAGSADGPHPAAHHLDEGLDDEEAQAVAADGGGPRIAGAIETVEDAGDFVGRDAEAAILHVDQDEGTFAPDADLDAPAFRRVFDGVADKVVEDLEGA